MSLIPSESYSFPDHFVRTISRPRKPVEDKVLPPPPPPVRSEPAPKSRASSQTRAVSIVPTPKREQAPPPPERAQQAQETRPLLTSLVPASLKRKARWNMRATEPPAPLNGNGTNVPTNRTLPSAPLVPKPKPVARPKISLPSPAPTREQAPAPASRPPEPIARIVEAPSADLVQTLLARSLYAAAEPVEVAPAQPEPPSPPRRNEVPTNSDVAAIAADEDFTVELLNGGPAPAKKRRSPKLRKFLLWETVTIAVLIPLSIVGFLRVFQAPIAVLFVNVATITAAVAATLMPIVFFALAPPLPRGEE